MEFKEKYTYEDFLDIIAMLRSENGCPWDKVQTHDSLRPCMMEEAAEVLAAIRIYDTTGNAGNLQEELGDVLLQVVMHAQIAKEEGLFNMEDVVNDVAQKMVRRHPHVFGTVEASTSEQVLQNWEEIKKQEKAGQTWASTPLRDIPIELPALTRATKVLKKVDKLYNKQEPLPEKEEQRAADLAEKANQKVTAVSEKEEQRAADLTEKTNQKEAALLKIEEAVHALRSIPQEAYSQDAEAQVGEILMNVCDVARLYKLSPEQILTDRIEDVISTYEP